MRPSFTCPRCGSRLADGAQGRLFCAVCVLRDALEPDPRDSAVGPRLPRSFGAYELQEELGRGGMGVVYRAWQPALRRHVALKFLLAGAFSSEAELRRFRLEAEAAAGLQHPGIIAIHDVGEFDGQPYYAMEYVAGPNLARLCEQRRLRPEHAARFTRDLATAVAYAHQRGVLHRDLKPSNVLVGADGRPRIGDFGVARRIDSASGATLTGQVLGSPGYAPPEQIAGDSGRLGSAGDIYGLGALLYHLLTGRAPFEATSPTETMRLVLNAEPASPRLLNAHVPADLETICLCCLEKDPARRYPSATALAEDLDRFLQREPIRAQPPSAWYRAWLFCRRHQWLVGTIAGAFLLLIVALAIVTHALTRERAAFARTLAAERAEQEARSQAGKFASSMTSDFGYTLQRYTKVALLQQVAEQTVAYYEQMPAPQRGLEVDRRHAAALEQLAGLRWATHPSDQAGTDELLAAIRLRDRIIRADANDADSAALVLWDRWRLAWLRGEKDKTDDPAWRDEYVQRWRELVARFPTSLPAQGCLAWALGRQAILLAQQNLRPTEVVALALEGRQLIEEMERLPRISPDEENHLFALSQGSLAALAIAYCSAGDTTRAVQTREECLARCAAALERDPGNRMLRALTAASAVGLAQIPSGISSGRRHEAFTLAQTHYRLLVELDETHLEYAFAAAESLVRGHTWHLAEADARGALEELVRADALLDRLRTVNAQRVVELGYAGVPAEAAALCALLGETGDASRYAGEARERLAACARDPRIVAPRLRAERHRAAQHLALAGYVCPPGPERVELFGAAHALLASGSTDDPPVATARTASTLLRGLEHATVVRKGRASLSPAGFPDRRELPARPEPPDWLDVWARRAVFDSAVDAHLGAGEAEPARRLAAELLAEEEQRAHRSAATRAAQLELAAALLRVVRANAAVGDAAPIDTLPLLGRAERILRPDGKPPSGEQTILDRRLDADLEQRLAAKRDKAAR